MAVMATKSVQPRFKDEFELMNKIISMIQRSDIELPKYQADTRERDNALLHFYRSEPLLSGVLSSAVSRDKNRGWTLTGAARQVSSYGSKLHNVHDNEGWRTFVSLNATAWYSTDLGYISEIGFKTKGGVPETMWHMDSSRLRMSGQPKTPMIYYPQTGKVFLKREEYIHGNSMPSIEEGMKRAGYCAIERALEFARLMIGLNRHNLEKIGVAPPKGILLGKGITKTDWQRAVDQANEDSENLGNLVYKGVMMLFSNNPDAALELIALSQLPDNFSLKQFVETIMQGYALAFGYPVGEFWAIETGSFGRTGELEAMQQQATAKGELDFALSFQEQLQTYFLPSTVNFQFDQRNDKGDLVKNTTDKVKFDMIIAAYQAKDSVGENLISKEEARILLSNIGVIPDEWATDDEKETTSDLQEVRKRALETPEVLRAAYDFPDEPIVSYYYGQTPGNINNYRRNDDVMRKVMGTYTFPVGFVTVLWDRGENAITKRHL
jgi:hypothetical protein